MAASASTAVRVELSAAQQWKRSTAPFERFVELNANKGSGLGGAVFLALAAVAIFLFGGVLLMSGLSALEAGQITVSYAKKGAGILLRPESSPWRFYGEVWLRLLLGALLIAASLAAPIKVLLMPSARRAERLRAASSQGRFGHGTKVPPLIACVVIVAFLAVLAFAH